jgi:hypothetical protein
MNERFHIHTDALLAEISRYLTAVDAFRAAGCEPTWQSEAAAQFTRLPVAVPALPLSGPPPFDAGLQ